ncbi:MAG: DUF3140 domain-containing protein [Lautropia sp.]
MDEQDREAIYRDFHAAVNLAPAELEKWLETDDSKAVGSKPDGDSAESVGHRSGRRIVDIKRKRKADLDPEDFAHMRKVVGYVHRHLEQRPSGDVERTRWRYSLMNWGHDPMR